MLLKVNVKKDSAFFKTTAEYGYRFNVSFKDIIFPDK